LSQTGFIQPGFIDTGGDDPSATLISTLADAGTLTQNPSVISTDPDSATAEPALVVVAVVLRAQ
jgi:hypothetical protein